MLAFLNLAHRSSGLPDEDDFSKTILSLSPTELLSNAPPLLPDYSVFPFSESILHEAYVMQTLPGLR